MVKESVKLGIVFIIPVPDPRWEAAVAIRCHARILPTWIQYRNEKDNTQFNTFLDHLSVSNVIHRN